jgi:GNAT superfamily N-acetyltransferase
MDGEAVPAGRDLIERVWRERWGLPIVTVRRSYLPDGVEGLVWRDAGGERGLVTWAIEGEEAEIVSLDAFETGRGAGSRLMDAAEAELRRRGVSAVYLTTTNDNLRAFAFYLRRGYRLVRLELDGVERVRAAKPEASPPAAGREGIPLRDMWELERRLERP